MQFEHLQLIILVVVLPVQKLLSATEEAQTESAGYQTELGTLSMTERRQRREKTKRIQEQKHRLKLSTIENLTRR